jgi:MarR family transcriptional regulator for hemolysin
VPTLEERFASALHASARSWRLTLDRRLKDLGLSQAAWLTISLVARASSPPSQAWLAERLGVEGATVVAMLDRLERSGHLRRRPCAADRRIKRISLTRSGRTLYGRVRVQAAALRRELLAGEDPAALAAATALLERLQAVTGNGE